MLQSPYGSSVGPLHRGLCEFLRLRHLDFGACYRVGPPLPLPFSGLRSSCGLLLGLRHLPLCLLHGLFAFLLSFRRLRLGLCDLLLCLLRRLLAFLRGFHGLLLSLRYRFLCLLYGLFPFLLSFRGLLFGLRHSFRDPLFGFSACFLGSIGLFPGLLGGLRYRFLSLLPGVGCRLLAYFSLHVRHDRCAGLGPRAGRLKTQFRYMPATVLHLTRILHHRPAFGPRKYQHKVGSCGARCGAIH